MTRKKINNLINKTTEKLKFVEFIEKKTNLFVAFSVFSVMFVYSSSLESFIAAQFLLVGFFVLTTLVWIEILISALNYSSGDFRFKLFYFASATVLIGLVCFLIEALTKIY